MEPDNQPQYRAMTFRLDAETWLRFRTILLKERKSMQDVFEDYVKRYIEAKEQK